MKSPSKEGKGIKVVTTETQMRECAKLGLKVPSKEVANEEDIDVVMCPTADTPTTFTDNEYGECSQCGVKIMWRPSAPKAQKVCIPCGYNLALEEMNGC